MQPCNYSNWFNIIAQLIDTSEIQTDNIRDRINRLEYTWKSYLLKSNYIKSINIYIYMYVCIQWIIGVKISPQSYQ